MGECSVMIAAQQDSFVRLIEHVLHGHPGLRIVGRTTDRSSFARSAGRLTPDVIIASTRLFGREPGDDVLAEVKRSSPASTLILLTRAFGEPVPSTPGTEARLPEDTVLRRLVPVVRKLAAQVRDRVPGPGRAGRRS